MVGNFDIDLDFGNVFEDKLKDIFEGVGADASIVLVNNYNFLNQI